MASVAQTIRNNQQLEINRQLASTNFEAPEVPEVANGIPVSNDAAAALGFYSKPDPPRACFQGSKPVARHFPETAINPKIC